MKLSIREISLSDMDAYIELKQHIKSNASYLPFEQDENIMSKDAEQKLIETYITSHNSTVLLAFNKDKLIGHIDILGYMTRRQRHIAGTFLAIHQKHRGKGVGAALMREAIAWSIAHDIKRLEVTININNDAAVKLYQSFDFKEEGIRKKAAFIDGEYFDEYYLAKLL